MKRAATYTSVIENVFTTTTLQSNFDRAAYNRPIILC